MTKLIKIGLYLCLFTPLLFWKTFMYPFITLKVVVFNILVETIFLLWLILILPRIDNVRKSHFLTLDLTKVLVAFLAVLFIVSVFGIDFQRSFFSTSERQLGLFALVHFFIFFLILSDFIKKGLLNWKRYLFVCFLVSLVMAGLAFYQIKNPSFFFVSSGERPGGTLGNPIFLASYLLFNVFVGLLLIAEARKLKFKSILKTIVFQSISIIFLSISVLFLIYSILLTETRGAILGLFFGFIFLFFYFSIFSFKKRNKIVFALFLILLLSSSVYFWQTKDEPFWQKIPGIRRMATTSLKGSSVQPRLLSWQSALKGIKQKPFFGWGFENYRYAFSKYFNPKLLKFGWYETYWDKPHNIFLEYLIAGGIVGLLAYLSIFAMAFWIILRKKSKKNQCKEVRLPYIGAAFVSYLACNAFNFDTFGSYLMLFIVLGMIDSNFKEIQSPEVSPSITTLLPSITTLLLFITIFYSLYFNFSLLYFNKRHYQGINYFVNKEPELGLSQFKLALNPFYPYVNETRRDFASVIKQWARKYKLPHKQKNVSWAIKELQKAVQSKPNNYFLNLNLADMIAEFYKTNSSYLEIGGRAAERALELSPSRQQAFYVAAKIKFLKGEKEKAYKYIKKSVELEPEIAESHFYLGLIALEIGKKEEGFKEIEIAKKKGRDSRKFLESKILADHFADAKKFDEAISYYNRALSQATENSQKAEVKIKLGAVYLLQEQIKKGVKLINEAIVLYPEIKNSQFYLQLKDALGL